MFKKITISLSFIMVLSISGCYMIQKSGTYYGVKTKGKNIVFLVDISGSMEGKNEGNITDQMRARAMNEAGDAIGSMIKGPFGGLASKTEKGESTKLGSAKRELIPAIKGLKEDNKFTVYTFESRVRNFRSKLVSPDTTNTTAAIAYVKNLSARGGTSALKGLKSAFSVKGVDMIFFLSDGYPSDASADKILKEVQKMNSNKKIIINCVGLGDYKDEKFMKELASQNDGIYVEK